MELTSNDYRAISEKISEGSNYVEYSKGNETIAIECKLEIDGYEENGYEWHRCFCFYIEKSQYRESRELESEW